MGVGKIDKVASGIQLPKSAELKTQDADAFVEESTKLGKSQEARVSRALEEINKAGVEELRRAYIRNSVGDDLVEAAKGNRESQEKFTALIAEANESRADRDKQGREQARKLLERQELGISFESFTNDRNDLNIVQGLKTSLLDDRSVEAQLQAISEDRAARRRAKARRKLDSKSQKQQKLEQIRLEEKRRERALEIEEQEKREERLEAAKKLQSQAVEAEIERAKTFRSRQVENADKVKERQQAERAYIIEKFEEARIEQIRENRDIALERFIQSQKEQKQALKRETERIKEQKGVVAREIERRIAYDKRVERDIERREEQDRVTAKAIQRRREQREIDAEDLRKFKEEVKVQKKAIDRRAFFFREQEKVIDTKERLKDDYVKDLNQRDLRERINERSDGFREQINDGIETAAERNKKIRQQVYQDIRKQEEEDRKQGIKELEESEKEKILEAAEKRGEELEEFRRGDKEQKGSGTTADQKKREEDLRNDPSKRKEQIGESKGEVKANAGETSAEGEKIKEQEEQYHEARIQSKIPGDTRVYTGNDALPSLTIHGENKNLDDLSKQELEDLQQKGQKK